MIAIADGFGRKKLHTQSKARSDRKRLLQWHGCFGKVGQCKLKKKKKPCFLSPPFSPAFSKIHYLLFWPQGLQSHYVCWVHLDSALKQLLQLQSKIYSDIIDNVPAIYFSVL